MFHKNLAQGAFVYNELIFTLIIGVMFPGPFLLHVMSALALFTMTIHKVVLEHNSKAILQHMTV